MQRLALLDPSRTGRQAEDLEHQLRHSVVGQDEAIHEIVRAYQTHVAGLSPVGRPIGNFLFLGPTGSGKTRIVEATAESLLMDSRAVIKIDCAEFQHSHEVAKLIGSPPGYLGHRETRALLSQEALDQYHTDKVKLSFVLFDEIEKASDAVWNLLLGILDKATLTLGDNRKVDFSAAMVFMTSNLGATEMSSLLTPRLGFYTPSPEDTGCNTKLSARISRTGVAAARRKFTPEFINRLDKIVVFKSLGNEELRRIVDIELKMVQRRIQIATGNKPFVVHVSDSAKEFLLSNLWAMPDLPGQPFTAVNNYATNASAGGNNDQFNGRFDQNVSSKQRIFGRYTRWTDYNLASDPYSAEQKSASLPLTGTAVDFQTVQAVFGDTYTFTPNTIGDIRLSLFRFTYNSLPESFGSNFTAFGWPANLNTQVPWREVPYVCTQGFSDFCQEVTGITANNTFSFSPSLVRIMGRHTIKVGSEWRRLQYNFGKSNQASGVFNFDNVITSANPVSPGSTGYGFASFLLGYGANGQVPGTTGSPNGLQVPTMTAAQFTYQGYYVSDTFQVSKKLTLNYGVRWDLPGAYTERYNNESVWLPNAVSPLAQQTGLPIKGALGLVDTPQSPGRGSSVQHWKLFAPRIGAAYRTSNKTVIRAGYGIFFLPSDANMSSAPWSNPINSITTPWVSTTNGGYTPSATLSNPFPNGILQPPGRNPDFQSLLYGTGITSPVTDERYPYVQQWNVSVERQITDTLMVEAAYAGSRGVHLFAASGGGQVDQLPDQYLALGSKLQQLVPNPFYGLISSGTLANPTVQQGQLLLPFPQYTSVSVTGQSNRDSIYHSLQMKMEKRFHRGGTVLVAYTWSKFISDADTITTWLDPTGTIQDYNNLRNERALLGSDVPQHVVFSYVYDVPIGKGHRLLGNTHGFADKLVSGWGINGVSTFQSGLPLGFTTSSNLTGSYNGGTRPNVIAGCDKSISGSAQSRLTKWFNTSCFAPPAAFTFGSESRLDPNLRSAGVANWDFALFKTTQIAERYSLQFRTEFFNLFNRVQFGQPGSTDGNPSFGVVGSQSNNPRLIQFALRFSY